MSKIDYRRKLPTHLPSQSLTSPINSLLNPITPSHHQASRRASPVPEFLKFIFVGNGLVFQKNLGYGIYIEGRFCGGKYLYDLNGLKRSKWRSWSLFNTFNKVNKFLRKFTAFYTRVSFKNIVRKFLTTLLVVCI